MTSDSLWTYVADLADIGSAAIVLTLGATDEAPEESYLWGGSTDAFAAAIAESASELCEAEGRGGHLWVSTGDDSSRRIATLHAGGGWRLGWS